ncbi:MAG: hypothetical protein DWQ37_19005 [Planctomycetota bacterium]|nr:MAG: hypothetical protein DWQ37_19005 [Planctomycetota bacterium]
MEYEVSVRALSATSAVAMLTALLAGCDRTAQSAPINADRPLVRVTNPITRDVTEYAYFTGRTDAVESVEVRARVTGYLVSVDFHPGCDVEKGQRLFQID